MSDDSDSPWGSGKKSEGKSPWGSTNGSGGKRPQDDRPTSIPEIDDMVRKGQERLKVLLGGRGGGSQGGGSGRKPGGFSRGSYGLFALFLLLIWRQRFLAY